MGKMVSGSGINTILIVMLNVEVKRAQECPDGETKYKNNYIH